MKNLAIVDVLIAAWNRAATIERAIRSALAQSEVRAVIVVDDASTDDTGQRAQEIAAGSSRVIVRRLELNCGPAAARNLALEIATAPWVAVLDADDFFLPGRIGKLLSYIDEFDMIADDIFQIKACELGLQTPSPMLGDGNFEPGRISLEAFIIGNIGQPKSLRKELGFLKPLMRREFISRHGLQYNDRLRLGEDYALYAHCIALGARFALVPAQGYVAVLRDDSLSGRHTKRDLQRLRDVDLELASIGTLTQKDHLALRKHYVSVDSRVQWLSVIEAYKARRPARFLACFCRSPTVTLFLLGKIFDQALDRTAKWLRHYIAQGACKLFSLF